MTNGLVLTYSSDVAEREKVAVLRLPFRQFFFRFISHWVFRDRNQAIDGELLARSARLDFKRLSGKDEITQVMRFPCKSFLSCN